MQEETEMKRLIKCSFALMIVTLMTGCGDGAVPSDERDYGGTNDVTKKNSVSDVESELRRDIEELRFLPPDLARLDMSFKHSTTESTEKSCSFLKIFKSTCWKSKGPIEKNYHNESGVIRLNDDVASTNEIQTYRDGIKNHLLNVVLNSNAAKEISKISFSSLADHHSSIRSAANVSLALGGRGYAGEVIRVIHKSPLDYGHQTNAKFYFSFDVPLEANPIFEVWSSSNTEGRKFHSRYLSRGRVQ